MNDEQLLQAFHAAQLAPANFRHREHLRIAWLHLDAQPFEEACVSLKSGLLRLLAALGAPPTAYHETLTRAWLLAVAHFRHRVGPLANSEAFLQACPVLLEKEVMHTHYSPARLQSPAARAAFIEPDLDPIPRH